MYTLKNNGQNTTLAYTPQVTIFMAHDEVDFKLFITETCRNSHRYRSLVAYRKSVTRRIQTECCFSNLTYKKFFLLCLSP